MNESISVLWASRPLNLLCDPHCGTTTYSPTAGIRKCPAADVARMQIFLVIANLCKSFAFTTPDGDDGHIGTFYKAGTSVLRNPKPFRVVLFKRH